MHYIIIIIIIVFLGYPCVILGFLSYCKSKHRGYKKLIQKKITQYRTSLVKRLMAFFCISLVSILLSGDIYQIYSNIIDIYFSQVMKKSEIIDPYDYTTSINENAEIVTENIIKTGLFYEDCKGYLEDENCDKIEEYNNFAEKAVEVYGASPSIDLVEFGKLPEKKYFEGKTIRSVDEIDKEIDSYGDPQTVPVNLYIEEFYARAQVYFDKKDKENAYQIARAGDDIVDILAYNGGDFEEILYFSRYAVNYYLESLKYDISCETPYDIYLKISKILLKLELRSELTEYKKHFLLLANAFLSLGKNYDKEVDDLCCSQFDYYYGTTLYKVGINCNINDDKLYKESLNYITNYLENEDSKASYLKTCKDIKKKIINKYPSLDEASSNSPENND